MNLNLSSLKKIPSLVFLIAALTFLAYSFALQGSFKTMDDEISIVKNENIRSFGNIGKILTASFFGDKTYHRPMITISFMVEYHLWGLNPLYYYLTNILLHCINAIFVFFLIRRIFEEARLPDIASMAAYWTAILFAVHPVHWEAVSNIPGRSNLLCAFFYLGTLLLLDAAFRSKRKWIYVLSLLSFTGALLSKESAGVLPAFLVAYVVFLRPELLRKWRDLIWPLSGYVFIECAYILVRKSLGLTQIFYWGSTSEMFLGVVTFLRGVLTYFRLIVFPVDLQFDRARKVFTHFNDPEMLGTLVLFVIFFVWLLVNRKKIQPLILFFITWFFIDLLPVSQVFAAIGVQPGYISTAEHFLYTPLIPALALIMLSLRQLYELNQKHRVVSPRILKISLAGLFLFYYLLTIQHNIYSSNEIAMFERTLAIDPDNTRIRNALAVSYARIGLYAEAEKHFRRSLEVFPAGAYPRIGLGKALCDQGKYWEGIQEYEKVYDPMRFKELLEENIKLTYQTMVRMYKRRIQSNSANAQDYFSLGVVYAKTARPSEATAAFEAAVRLNPGFQNAWFNLSSTYEAAGELAKAAEGYERFLGLGIPPEPELLNHAYLHLAQIYEKLADYPKAQKYNSLYAEILQRQ